MEVVAPVLGASTWLRDNVGQVECDPQMTLMNYMSLGRGFSNHKSNLKDHKHLNKQKNIKTIHIIYFIKYKC